MQRGSEEREDDMDIWRLECSGVVGQFNDGDDVQIIGKHCHGKRNCRGEWLESWATTERLRIQNSMFRKPPDKAWTHQNGEAFRQIDYILTSKGERFRVLDVEACSDICVGRDHRTVAAIFEFESSDAHRSLQLILSMPINHVC